MTENTFWPKDEKGGHFYDLEGDYIAVWKELEKLVDEGLVETIGLSNFNEKECEEILAVARHKPVCNQVECHPYWPQDKLKSFLDAHGMALVAYSPLGNLDPNDTSKPSVLRDETILGLAKKHGKTPAQVIIRWHLQKGHVVIPKTVTFSRYVYILYMHMFVCVLFFVCLRGEEVRKAFDERPTCAHACIFSFNPRNPEWSV